MSHAPDPIPHDDGDRIPSYLAWLQFALTVVILGAVGSLAYLAGFTSSKGHGGGSEGGATAVEANANASADVTTLMTSTPALVAKGKTLFQVNCVTCHGTAGKGDGAAAPALNPKPRNFTSDQGWKFGSGVARIARTLTEGSPGTAMAAFAALSVPDRIALAHYVRSLNPKPDPDKQADLDWLGVGKPGAPTGGGAAAAGPTTPAAGPTISIEKAMALLTVSAPQTGVVTAPDMEETGEGAHLFASRCASCHGVAGQGGVRVRMLGSAPYAYVTTRSLGDASNDASSASFEKHVLQGLPGSMMPGNGDLSRSSLHELFLYTQTLRARQEAAGRGRSS